MSSFFPPLFSFREGGGSMKFFSLAFDRFPRVRKIGLESGLREEERQIYLYMYNDNFFLEEEF